MYNDQNIYSLNFEGDILIFNTETGKTILEPFMMDLTRETTFMMGSDKILTLAVPTPTLLEQYLNLIEE